MDQNQEVVGGKNINPISQEIIKTCSGGMIAVSSGLLLLSYKSEKEASGIVFIMLALHAFAIPCLILAKILYAKFDGYKRISAFTEKLLSDLAAIGLASSITGYFFTLYLLNPWILLAFSFGFAYAIYSFVKIDKNTNDIHMLRRE